jgi:aromatic ring-opening dioxygenase LigB subunit
MAGDFAQFCHRINLSFVFFRHTRIQSRLIAKFGTQINKVIGFEANKKHGFIISASCSSADQPLVRL